MSGAVSHLAGHSAEDQVAAHYGARGHVIDRLRWRGRGGEIDLITREGDRFVFVEVKRARSHARAAERISPRQIARIQMAAQEYVAASPSGLDSEMRFDVALLDAQGVIEIRENAFH